MSDVAYAGPSFERVEEIQWEDLIRRGGFGPRTSPILVKGAVRAWPAQQRWTFDRLAGMRHADGSEVMFRFSNGLVEQGVTKPPLELRVGPYIQGLADASSQSAGDDAGLLPYSRFKQIGFGEKFHLDWAYMGSFKADRIYLAQ